MNELDRKTVIELLDVGISFSVERSSHNNNRLTIFEGLTLTVHSGEIVGILGPSGCGKSTLLNVIAGFIPPKNGQARAHSRPIQGPGPDRAVIFQENALFPWLTVRGNIEFGPRCCKDVDRLRELEQYVSLVGLRGFEDFYPDQLSGGMKQRVALARALIQNADILLLDEPFGNLDAQTRESMQELLLAVQTALNPTMVFVTHDIEEAVFLSDRILVMSKLPARFRKEILVPLPRPRLNEMREYPAAVSVRRHLRSLLRS